MDMSDMWAFLESTHQSSSKYDSKVKLAALKRKFWTIKFEEFQNPERFIEALEEIRLEADYHVGILNSAFSADDIIYNVLEALRDPKFDSLKSEWSMVPEAEKTKFKFLCAVDAWQKNGGTGEEQDAGEDTKIKCPKNIKQPQKNQGASSSGGGNDNKQENPGKILKPKHFVYTFIIGQATPDEWRLSGAASTHVCGYLTWFTDYKRFPKPEKVQLLVGTCEAMGVGRVRLRTLVGSTWKITQLENVLYIPGGLNFFSQNTLFEKGLSAGFSSTGSFQFFHRDEGPSFSAECRDNGVIMNFRPVDGAE